MRKLILFIIIIGALLLSGCFKVDRNNPYDPQNATPEPEGPEVELFGVTLKGKSYMPLGNVEIQIDGKEVFSDPTTGEYTIKVSQGVHELVANKSGWAVRRMTIDTTRKAGPTPIQYQDIDMYIWGDDYESYTIINDYFNSDWVSDSSGNYSSFSLYTYNNNQGIQMEFNDLNGGHCQSMIEYPYPTGAIKPTGVYFKIIFGAGIVNCRQGFFLFNSTLGGYFATVKEKNNILYYSTTIIMDTEIIDITGLKGIPLTFIFYIDPNDGTQGELYIFDENNNPVGGANPLYLSLTISTDIDEISAVYLITTEETTGTCIGDMTILEMGLY